MARRSPFVRPSTTSCTRTSTTTSPTISPADSTRCLPSTPSASTSSAPSTSAGRTSGSSPASLDYMRFAGDRLPPNTGGVFIPSRGCLAAYLEGQGRDALRRTLQHEAFHQFTYSRHQPERARLDQRGHGPGLRGGHLHRPAVRRRTGARSDACASSSDDMDHKPAHAVRGGSCLDGPRERGPRTMRDRDRGSTQYNQAWAMVHFLDLRDRTAARAKRCSVERFFEMLQDDPARACDAGGRVPRPLRRELRGVPEVFRRVRPRPDAHAAGDLRRERRGAQRHAHGDVQRRTPGASASLADFRTHLERGGYPLAVQQGGDAVVDARRTSGIYFRDCDGPRPAGDADAASMPRPDAPLPDLIAPPARRRGRAAARIPRPVLPRTTTARPTARSSSARSEPSARTARTSHPDVTPRRYTSTDFIAGSLADARATDARASSPA